MKLLLLALVPACFALNPVTGRALVEDFGPATLSLLRWSLSGLVIAAIALMRPGHERWHAPPSHLLRLALLGALAMGFCATAAYVASRTTEATSIGLIYGCTSAFVAAWEIAAGRQRATPLLLAGIAACLFGVVLILTKGHPEALAALRFTPGDLWATGHAGVRRLHHHHAPRAGGPHAHAAVRRHDPRGRPRHATVRGGRDRLRRPAGHR
jgi:drug/metabolite transporter (DMT)-like permease